MSLAPCRWRSCSLRCKAETIRKSLKAELNRYPRSAKTVATDKRLAQVSRIAVVLARQKAMCGDSLFCVHGCSHLGIRTLSRHPGSESSRWEGRGFTPQKDWVYAERHENLVTNSSSITRRNRFLDLSSRLVVRSIHVLPKVADEICVRARLGSRSAHSSVIVRIPWQSISVLRFTGGGLNASGATL
jgi:hypothetical protein